MDNLELWNSVEVTNPKHTKRIKVGAREFTAICPHYQRKLATEKFGPYGMGWGIKPDSEHFEFKDITEETTLLLYRGVFFYGNELCDIPGLVGAFPINASLKVKYKTSKGFFKIDDDCMKKVQTDALTKGLSFLGFNADVFEGKFDDNKYVAQVNEEFKAKRTVRQEMLEVRNDGGERVMLKMGTEDWAMVVDALKEGKRTVAYVCSKFQFDSNRFNEACAELQKVVDGVGS